MNHCCEQMQFFVQEGKVSILYDPKIRFYGIELKKSHALQKINFCPWCSSKLPNDLNELYGKIISDDLKLDIFDKNYKKKIPSEFKTDEWWKKRGL